MSAARKKRQREENPHFKTSYTTVEEGAQAKADYLMNVVLKYFDWNQFMEMRKKEAEKR